MIQNEAPQIINNERLFNRLMELGEIGLQKSGGVTRLALSKEDYDGIKLLSNYMKEADLKVRMDAAGNLIGRKEGEDPYAPVVLTGSHSDTVFDGGKFDGGLGIIGGIEALQTMNEHNVITEHPIEVIAYRDEEGCRFTSGYSSCSAMVGGWDPDKLNYTDNSEITIADALKANQLDPERIGEASRENDSIKAHVELHIEQGKVLEQRNLSVGIVEGICSFSKLRVRLNGDAGHAGTTPMEIRRDPLVAAAKIIQVIEEEATNTGTSVGTVGKIDVHPGGVNIIPDQVEFSIDIRDFSEHIREQMEETVLSEARNICHESGIKMEIVVWRKETSKPCTPLVQDKIREACNKMDLKPYTLSSGAGHDSGCFVDFCPMGMIFVRSKDGVSHNPLEWSSSDDCADGVNVLYYTLLDLAVSM